MKRDLLKRLKKDVSLSEKPSTIERMRETYAHWAPFYDLVYTKLMSPARRAAVSAAMACGSEILEVGVGTGLSLQDYDRTVRVAGIDLSEPMLRRAIEKVSDRALHHIGPLAVMDACRLGFPSERFNAVVGQLLITLVPDPEQALDEFARVLRPGGEIILANHFGVANGPLARIEERLAPLAARIGWSSDFKVERLAEWAGSRPGIEFIDVSPVFPAGFFKIVRMRKHG